MSKVNAEEHKGELVFIRHPEVEMFRWLINIEGQSLFTVASRDYKRYAEAEKDGMAAAEFFGITLEEIGVGEVSWAVFEGIVKDCST